MSIFCERLRHLRQEKGYSKSALGKMLNVSHTTISRWEKGDIVPTIGYVYQLSKIFNVSSDYLLGLEN